MSERFEHPALYEVYSSLALIEEAEAQLKTAKRQLEDAVMDLPSKIGDNDDLQYEIFHQLYWFNDNIPALWLREAFKVTHPSQTPKSALTKLMKSAHLEVTCTQCKQPFQIEVTSRSNLQHRQQWIKRGLYDTCDSCKERDRLETDQWYEQQQKEALERIHMLQAMPYRDYLQTPEWQARRLKAMKRAGFRCQLCNAYGKRLNTHHRTYERRGKEYDSDLIVLCQDCHQIFHENGSLASGRKQS